MVEEARKAAAHRECRSLTSSFAELLPGGLVQHLHFEFNESRI